MRVRRVFDEKHKTLLYIAYSTRLGSGVSPWTLPKHKICCLPKHNNHCLAGAHLSLPLQTMYASSTDEHAFSAHESSCSWSWEVKIHIQDHVDVSYVVAHQHAHAPRLSMVVCCRMISKFQLGATSKLSPKAAACNHALHVIQAPCTPPSVLQTCLLQIN